jgi:hypothetical protein
MQSYEGYKQEHDKKVGLLRKQEVKGVDYLKMEKNKMEIESLESKMLVATQSIEITTTEIIRLRESELFPQLLELAAGLVECSFHHHHPSSASCGNILLGGFTCPLLSSVFTCSCRFACLKII